MRYLVSALTLAAFLTGGAAFAQTPRAPQRARAHATASRSVDGHAVHKTKKHPRRHSKRVARHAGHNAPVVR